MTNSTFPQGTIFLSHYASEIAPTDILDAQDLRPVQRGLFGEVGGIMSASKKHVREGALFPEYQRAAEEEFGDTLWYLAALCRRCDVDLAGVLDLATNDGRWVWWKLWPNRLRVPWEARSAVRSYVGCWRHIRRIASSLVAERPAMP